ncbi:MAG: VPLPA-CTERM sorting domain-containing protein [Tranquillimonas sp.]
MKVAVLALATTAFSGLAFAASAAQVKYFDVNFSPLNNSMVEAFARLTYKTFDSGDSRLSVELTGSGFEPGAHAGHIHGFEDFEDSVAPTRDVFDPDTQGDKDGFTELAEGLPFYGGILLTFPGIEADASGNIDYSMSFDVMKGSFLDDATYPLTGREIVLHGLTIPVDAGMGTDGEADGNNPTQEAFLPIAAGEIEISPVPLPAAGWLLIGAIGGLGGLRLRRRAA